MNNFKFGHFLQRLRDEFTEYFVAVRPFTSEEDAQIKHFVYVLNVPRAHLHTAACRAWDLAFQHYPPDAVPFHLTTVSSETAISHFAAEMQWFRWSSIWRDQVGRVTKSFSAPGYGQPWTFNLKRDAYWMDVDRGQAAYWQRVNFHNELSKSSTTSVRARTVEMYKTRVVEGVKPGLPVSSWVDAKTGSAGSPYSLAA